MCVKHKRLLFMAIGVIVFKYYKEIIVKINKNNGRKKINYYERYSTNGILEGKGD